MKSLPFKTIPIVLLAFSVLLLSSCGKKDEEPAGSSEVVIPDSPDAAVKTVITEFSNGNGGIAWKALPASYQSDIRQLVHRFGSSADEEVYNKSFSLFSHLTNVIDQQKYFIANSSLIKDQSPENSAQLEAALPSIIGLMNAIASSELSSIEGLLNFNGESFFETTVSECVKHLEAIGKLTGEETVLGDYASVEVSLVSKNEDQAVLSIVVPGQAAEEIAFAKVENRWVPVEMENNWQATMKKMKDSIREIPAENYEAQKTQILGVLTMLDGMLTNIESAETQEQFDQSLKDSTMPLLSTLMMFRQTINGSD